jgi:outer membrane protein assembly factor BamB
VNQQFPGLLPVLHGHVQTEGSDPRLEFGGSLALSTLGTHTLYRAAGSDVQAYRYDEVTSTCGPSGGLACPTWTFTADAAIVGSPVLAGGGETVYVGTQAGTVYALDGTTGTVRWSQPIASLVGGAPALANGVLYVPTRSGGLVAIDAATGAVEWTGSTGSTSSVTKPAIGGGVVFVAASDGTVAALDAAGCGSTSCDPLWTTNAGAPVSGAPVVDGGQLYVPLQGYLVAYRPAAS